MFVYALAIALAFWPGALDPASTGRWAVMAVGAPLLLMTYARTPPQPLEGVGAATIITMLATAAWSPDLLYAAGDAAHLLVLAMVFCLGAAAPDLRQAWAGLAAGVTVSAAIALAQLAGWRGIEQASGVAGLFMNKNLLAEAGLVALVAALASRTWWAVPGGALALAIGQSRAAFGAAAFALGVAMLARHRRAGLLWIALCAFSAIALFAAEHPATVMRMDMWRQALGNLAWFGHGLGSYPAHFHYFEFPHSEPVHLAYELGLFALLPAGILAYVWMERTHDTEHLVLAAILAVGLFSFPLRMPLTGFAAALAAGHLAGWRARVRRPDDGSRAPDAEDIRSGRHAHA